jgi:hypothetical protein
MKQVEDILDDCFEGQIHTAFTMLCVAIANKEKEADAHFANAVEIAHEARAQALVALLNKSK